MIEILVIDPHDSSHLLESQIRLVSFRFVSFRFGHGLPTDEARNRNGRQWRTRPPYDRQGARGNCGVLGFDLAQ